LTGIDAEVAKAQAREDADEEAMPQLAVGDWTVTLCPRLEWVGDLDGYYREITGRLPLTINESSMSTSD
jgi:hypothetical protein